MTTAKTRQKAYTLGWTSYRFTGGRIDRAHIDYYHIPTLRDEWFKGWYARKDWEEKFRFLRRAS